MIKNIMANAIPIKPEADWVRGMAMTINESKKISILIYY